MPKRTPHHFHSFIKFGILPTCVLVVVFVHFYTIQKGLSPWKGGGFGMYSTYHPTDFQLYVNGVYIDKKTISNQQQMNLKTYLFYPNSTNLEVLISSLNSLKDTLNIQIWQPDFNAKTSTYSRILKHECTYIKPISK